MNINDLSEVSYFNVPTPSKDINNFVAVIPWGAIEPHNHHLPYLTDCILAREIALKSVNRLDETTRNFIVVFPYIFAGSQNPGQTDYPFCIHFNTETQKAILKDIVVGLNWQGVKKIVILNGHMGNCFKSIVRDLEQEFKVTIVVIDWLNIPSLPQSDYFENKEDHAGEVETSAMLYFHPELVDMSKASDGISKDFSIDGLKNKTGWTPRDWSKISHDTGVGDPRKASLVKGALYIDKVTIEISKLLYDFIWNSSIY